MMRETWSESCSCVPAGGNAISRTWKFRSKSESSIQYGKSSPSGTSASFHRNGGSAGRRSSSRRWRSLPSIFLPGAVSGSRIASPPTWPVWRADSSARNWASRLVSCRTTWDSSSSGHEEEGLAQMKMRAAVLQEFGQPLVVEEVDLGEPRAGEVLVRLVACGVCHTDLYTASGVDPSGYSPTVLGHEGGGVVEAIGDGVRDLAVGDHVVT